MVSEIFGPTWQGEGPSLGMRAGFVRLGRCNLSCTWCDTPYTWDWQRFDPEQELTRLDVEEIAARVLAMDVPLVVITGGEPLLQQTGLIPLIRVLRERGERIEIETAGTVAPAPELLALVDGFNVSPKLENSGNALSRRLKTGVLAAFAATGRARFKFVVSGGGDLDEIAEIAEACSLPADAVWVMAEGTDPTTIIETSRSLADQVLARGWNLTTRLHVLLWGDQRGR